MISLVRISKRFSICPYLFIYCRIFVSSLRIQSRVQLLGAFPKSMWKLALISWNCWGKQKEIDRKDPHISFTGSIYPQFQELGCLSEPQRISLLSKINQEWWNRAIWQLLILQVFDFKSFIYNSRQVHPVPWGMNYYKSLTLRWQQLLTNWAKMRNTKRREDTLFRIVIQFSPEHWSNHWEGIRWPV